MPQTALDMGKKRGMVWDGAGGIQSSLIFNRVQDSVLHEGVWVGKGWKC